MTSKLGPHIIEPYRIKQYDNKVAASKNRIYKIMGGPTEFGFMAYLNALLGSQNHLFIARVAQYDKAVRDAFGSGASPYEAADIMLNALTSFVRPNGFGYAYFECGMNEPVGIPMEWLNSYFSYIVPRLREAGIRSVSFNFSVCNPQLSDWEKLGNALNVIKQAGPEWALVGLHEYGLHGNMQDYAEAGNDARILRHRCIPQLADQHIVITETGLDEPGWKRAGVNSEGYFADFQWLDYELRKDDNVLGAAIYTMDSAPGWENYTIDGSIADHLFSYWQTQNANPEPIFPDEPTPPPPDPEPDPEPGNYRVTADALNVRSSPEVLGETNKIRLQGVAPLPHNAQVQVLEFDGDWARIAPPFETWVHSDYIERI